MAPPAEHLDILQPSPIAGVTGPHSRRVLSNSPGANAGPVNYTRPTSMYESSSSSSSSAHLPVPSRSPGTPKTAKIPPIPARSPLRPRPRAIVSSVQVLADARNLVAQVDDMPLTPNQSGYSSFANLLESMDLNDSSPRPPSKLPGRPDSNVLGTDLQPESGPSSSTSSLSQAPQTLSKRTHALLEMLTTERAYASDLALIRDVHVPLALGMYFFTLLIIPLLTSERPTRTFPNESSYTTLIWLIYTHSIHGLRLVNVLVIPGPTYDKRGHQNHF